MADRLGTIAHGAVCITFGALAVVAWLVIASLMFAGFCIVYAIAFIRVNVMPVAIIASLAGSVAMLLFATAQVSP